MDLDWALCILPLNLPVSGHAHSIIILILDIILPRKVQMLHDFILEAVSDALVVVLVEHDHFLRWLLLGRCDLKAARGHAYAKVILAGSVALLGLRGCVCLGVISSMPGGLSCLQCFHLERLLLSTLFIIDVSHNSLSKLLLHLPSRRVWRTRNLIFLNEVFVLHALCKAAKLRVLRTKTGTTQS